MSEYGRVLLILGVLIFMTLPWLAIFLTAAVMLGFAL